MKKILLGTFSLFIVLTIFSLSFTQKAFAAADGEENGYCRDTEPYCNPGLICKEFNFYTESGRFCFTQADVTKNNLDSTYTPDMNQINLSIIQKSIGNTSIPTSINCLISRLIPYIFTIAGILLLIFFIVSGFQFIFAGGDPKKMEAAKAHITTALIGFIIIFVAYWLVQVLGRIFNIQIITDIFK
jgi:uncharacterized membrane protein